MLMHGHDANSSLLLSALRVITQSAHQINFPAKSATATRTHTRTQISIMEAKQQHLGRVTPSMADADVDEVRIPVYIASPSAQNN
jgi:hypothetical protein